MKPNEVQELLRSLIQEIGLPILVTDKGPLFISEVDNKTTRSYTEDIIRRWKGDRIADKLKNFTISGHWCLSRGRNVSEVFSEVDLLASDSTRIPDVMKALGSLISESELPFKIFHLWFTVIILPDEPGQFQSDEMVELENIMNSMRSEGCFGEDTPNFHVRHGGFWLYSKEEVIDIQFSKVQQVVDRLQTLIGKHGLQVRLIHNGFQLEKDREVEIDIAEAEELAFRLACMTSVNYRVGAYGMGPTKGRKAGWTNQVNWKNARMSSSRPW